MPATTVEVLQRTANMHGGSPSSPFGRCIYNLRLQNKFSLEGDTEIKCGRLCNGSSRLDGSLNPCDFYTDSQDYFLETCAWHVRAKRRKDRHEFLQEDILRTDEEKCLNCSATLEQGCSSYVNVKHIIDEICAKKAHIENEIKRGNLQIIEQINVEGCRSCPGKANSHNCNGSGGYCSMREMYEFWRIFPQTKPTDSLITIAA